jgi:hypothetical protein
MPAAFRSAAFAAIAYRNAIIVHRQPNLAVMHNSKLSLW